MDASGPTYDRIVESLAGGPDHVIPGTIRS
jgi:hypothetical protein